MVRSGKTAQEFIQDSFSPIVAVLCSSKVENVVSKNNLSFTELLQPFTTLESEGQFRDPSGNICTIKNWKLIIRDVNWKPLQPTEARRQLNNAVLHNYHDKTVPLEFDGRKFDIPQSTHWFDAWRETYLEVQFPSDHEYTKHFVSCIIVGTAHDENVVDSFNNLNQQYAQLQNVTPPKLPKWFNSGVLKSYLLLHDVSAVSQEKANASFETLKQTFGATNCFMLAINSKSTLDQSVSTDLWAQYIKRTPDLNNEMSASLINLPISPAEPQVFPPATAINSEDITTISTSINQENDHPLTAPEPDIYDNANSLQTHSLSGSSESVNVAGKTLDLTTEVHGIALNANDVNGIKKFVTEYATKALLPYMEKQILQLSEVVANRKGVSRSLLSATKRWFGTGKSGNTTGNSNVIYTPDCPELQLRRLGDLWFLCRQWQRAFDAYHSAKREFYADSAWLCYAGALEMAAISAFMAGDANRKTHGYMEESIVTYLNTCRMVQYAVRATLLSVICLEGLGLQGEAAKQLIRMTSEDSDLRSAMLLEQAALCFMTGPGAKAMCRKYAFHMVLAGHRFTKAGQKKHAYRCYKQAYQVYGRGGWRLATDHVQFALGRLAGARRAARDALRWLAAPLAPASPQPPHQQAAFLREYMRAHQQCVESERAESGGWRLEALPLPLVVLRETCVVCVGPAPLASPRRLAASSLAAGAGARPEAGGGAWRVLEEMLVQVAQGALPMIFKPTLDLYTEAADCEPLVPQGEPVQISVTLWNPLKISLVLKDVELLWRFVVSADEAAGTSEMMLSNEQSVAAGQPLETNIIYSQRIKSVLLEGDCKKVVVFTITPLKVGQLNVHGLAYKLISAGEGSNENGNNVMISGKVNLISEGKADKRLQITVIPEAPCLQMTFSETNSEILSGEMRTIDVEFTNVGPVEMKNLYLAVSHPDCISLVTSDNEDDFKALYEEKYRDPPSYSDERARRAGAWRAAAARHVRGAADVLPRGAALRARLLLRPRRAAPALRLLAYYETGLPRRPYRLLRHVFRFEVSEAVELSVAPRRGAGDGAWLAVEAESAAPAGWRVRVLEAALLGRGWRLEGSVGAGRSAVPLGPREKLHFVLRARRTAETPPEGKLECSRVDVAGDRPDVAADVIAPPYSKFLMESRPRIADDPETIVYPETETESERTGSIRSMFVLRWIAHDETKGKTAIGQHCLWLDCFSRATSHDRELIAGETPPLQLDNYESATEMREINKTKKGNVVILRLEHSNYINHNFKERKLCLVPVTLNIVNCYGVPIKVFIDMSKQRNRELSSELGWAGALSCGPDVELKALGVSVTLGKFESKRVHVRGVCAAPGTYLVGSAFSVTTIADDTSINISNVSNNTSLLIVQQVA